VPRAPRGEKKAGGDGRFFIAKGADERRKGFTSLKKTLEEIMSVPG